MVLVSALLVSAAEAYVQKPAESSSSRQGKNAGKTVRKVRVAEDEINVAPAVIEAEGAIEKKDYPRAESLLLKVTELDPNDFRAWFDLAFVYNVTDRKAQAIDAYRKSIALKPTVQEANLNLGLLLAEAGKKDEAAKYLRAATTLKPDSKSSAGVYRAWLSLAQVLKETAPAESIAAFREAAKLQPNDPEPHLSLANAVEKSDPAASEAEYKQALALDPKSTDAMAGLVNLYTSNNRLGEAQNLLRAYLQLEPGNPTANLQMGRILVKAQKPEEALTYFETGLKSRPDDRDLLHAVAAMYSEAKKYPEAEERYRSLVQVAPQDALAHRGLARALLYQQKFPEAEKEFFEAIKLEPKHADTYADFALAASKNKKFALVVRALDERAKYAPDGPATFFLRATAYDSLKAYKEAAANYHRFLEVADGRFPDQEWQARHRLIAIEPEQKKK
jgi:Flp pilus assembly protein TadD